MNKDLRDLAWFFLVLAGVICVGWWLAGGLVASTRFQDGHLAFLPTMAGQYRWSWPRWYGVVWMVGPAASFMLAARARAAGEELAISFFLFIGILGASLVVCLVGGWLGGWLTLLWVIILGHAIARLNRGDRFDYGLLLTFVLVGGFIGPWTGLLTGAIHGLVATLAYIATSIMLDLPAKRAQTA